MSTAANRDSNLNPPQLLGPRVEREVLEPNRCLPMFPACLISKMKDESFRHGARVPWRGRRQLVGRLLDEAF